MPTAQSFENLFPILFFCHPLHLALVELSLHINKKAASHRDTASNIYVRIHSLQLRMLRGTRHRKKAAFIHPALQQPHILQRFAYPDFRHKKEQPDQVAKMWSQVALSVTPRPEYPSMPH